MPIAVFVLFDIQLIRALEVADCGHQTRKLIGGNESRHTHRDLRNTPMLNNGLRGVSSHSHAAVLRKN